MTHLKASAISVRVDLMAAASGELNPVMYAVMRSFERREEGAGLVQISVSLHIFL